MYLDIKYEQELKTVNIDGKRHYVSPETGLSYPSVTTVLADHGKEGLDKWRARIGHKEAAKITQKAANFGTKIHTLAENYIRGNELPKVMPDEMARFRQLVPVIDYRIDAVFACEAALWSDKLQLAGRTDVIGVFDGKNSIIDFKTARKPKKLEWVDNYWLQECFYALMWAERTKDISLAPKQLVLLISVEGENQPQIMTQPVNEWVEKSRNYLKKYRETHKLATS